MGHKEDATPLEATPNEVMAKRSSRLVRAAERMNPRQMRMLFDFALAAFAAIVTAVFSAALVHQESFSFVALFTAPALVVSLQLAAGLYGARRQSRVPVKLSLIGVSLVVTVGVLGLCGGSWPLLGLWAFISLFPLVLPRCLVGLTLGSHSSPLASALKDNGPVLIVGGAGYIGNEVVRQLLAANRSVRVLDRLVYGQSALKDYLKHPLFELIEGDATDISKLTTAMYGASSVVHLAGLVGDPACAVDENMTRHLNIITTRMVKEIAKSFGIRRFVFASSCSVYGVSDLVLDEEGETNPVSLYAQTKVDSEKELLADAGSGFQPVILRFATVFGHSARPRFDLVTNLFTAQAFTDGKIRVFGPGQWRPFIHVRDVARAVIFALNARSELVAGEIFNVGDDSLNTTIGELANVVQKVVSAVRPVDIEVNGDFKDARNYAVSFEKIRTRLGYKAQTTLAEGVAEILRHMQAGDYRDYRNAEFSNVEVTRKIASHFYDPENAERIYAPMQDNLRRMPIKISAAEPG